MDEIKLGSKVQDQLSDFEGTAVARAEYLFDVPQILVQSQDIADDGKAPSEWIAEARLLVQVPEQTS